jgi:hypothetical protein
MKTMAPWQRAVYNLGEALMVAGILWGLYRAFILRSCPLGSFNDLTLIVAGLLLSILPLHPFAVGAARGRPGDIADADKGRPRAAPTQAAGKMPAPPAGTPAPPKEMPAYLIPGLRRSFPLALACWLLALCGALLSLGLRVSQQPGMWWALGLLPAALYFWFGVVTRVNEPLSPPAQAPPPPEQEEGRDA